MTTSAPSESSRAWRRTTAHATYLVSTSPTLLNHDFINNAFSSPDMYWARPLPADQLALVLSSSLNLGLYLILPPDLNAKPPKSASSPSSPRSPSPTEAESPSMDFPEVEFAAATARAHAVENEEEQVQQIGMARFITDHVTTCYLTDVYVLPQHRGDGLGKWLVQCCGEIMDGMPWLRRAMLMASPGQGKKFYEDVLGMHDLGEEDKVVGMTRRGFMKGFDA